MLTSNNSLQAVVKNNRYNWDIINEADDAITVDQETTDEMLIEFPSNSSKNAMLPMFQT
jgi:hypothetical protein